MDGNLTHWKKLTNPDYLGAYALEPGQDLIATFASVGQEKVVGSDGKKEECTVAHFAEPGIKPMILNVTNCKTIANLYKTPYIEQWAGRRIQIYTESVRAFGETVDALRIRNFLPKVDELICSDCGQAVTDRDGYKAAAIASGAQKKYGRTLCFECRQKAGQAAQNKQQEGAQ